MILKYGGKCSNGHFYRLSAESSKSINGTGRAVRLAELRMRTELRTAPPSPFTTNFKNPEPGHGHAEFRALHKYISNFNFLSISGSVHQK